MSGLKKFCQFNFKINIVNHDFLGTKRFSVLAPSGLGSPLTTEAKDWLLHPGNLDITKCKFGLTHFSTPFSGFLASYETV